MVFEAHKGHVSSTVTALLLFARSHDLTGIQRKAGHLKSKYSSIASSMGLDLLDLSSVALIPRLSDLGGSWKLRRALEGSKGEGAPRGLLEAPRFRVLQGEQSRGAQGTVFFDKNKITFMIGKASFSMKEAVFSKAIFKTLKRNRRTGAWFLLRGQI